MVIKEKTLKKLLQCEDLYRYSEDTYSFYVMGVEWIIIKHREMWGMSDDSMITQGKDWREVALEWFKCDGSDCIKVLLDENQ